MSFDDNAHWVAMTLNLIIVGIVFTGRLNR